jgi:phage/plasmid-like protein (TIGR03299 family)
MAHYFDSGYVMHKPAWHGLAPVYDEYPENWDVARERSGLLWDPLAAPIYARRLQDDEMLSGITAILANVAADERPGRLLELFNGSLQACEGFQRTYRSDDYAATLGTMGRRYTPITHGEYGEIIEAVLALPNVKYETAGSVEGGKCTWAMALLDEPVQLTAKGKKGATDASLTLPYMLLTARHDGEGGVRLQETSVRVVCANTVRMAEVEADRDGTVFTFKHTENWRDRIEEARLAVSGVRSNFADYVEWAQEMLGIPITAKQAEQFVTTFVPLEPGITDRAARNVEEARQVVRGILEGTTSDGIAGTGFWLAQAGVEFLDHYRKTRGSNEQRQEQLFRRSILRPYDAKIKTINIVREIAGVTA